MSNPEIKAGRVQVPGWSEWAAAKELKIPWPRWQKAVAEGQVHLIEFGGLTRVTDAELERVRKVLAGELPPMEKKTQAA